MKRIWMAGAVAGGVLVMSATALAQSAPNAAAGAATPSAAPRERAEAREAEMEIRTVFLKDSEFHDMNDLQTDLRNTFHNLRIYAVPSDKAVTLEGTPDDVAKAQNLIAQLDKPRKQYRLTYRLTESDAGKRIGDQAYSLVAVAGEETVLKEGSRVPVSSGTVGTPTGAPGGTQIQYLDVGMDINATADAYGDGVRLQTKVKQSSLAEDKQSTALDDPIIRQTELEGTAVLMLGKPVALGSLDIPGSTRHQEVEVEVQAMP
jgi:type II secretory pathway component GspD/PulD (secretin)